MAQTQIVQHLAPIAELIRGCPTSTLIRNYVAGVRAFCGETRWLRRDVTGATVANQSAYNLGNDAYEEIVGIRAMSLRNTVNDRWRPVKNGAVTDWRLGVQAMEPREYAYLPIAQFALYPTPERIYDLAVTIVVQPKKGVVSIDEAMLTKWDEAFKAAALYRLFRIGGQPWSSMSESNNQLTLYELERNKALSDVAAGYNAGAASVAYQGPPNTAIRSRILAI